MRGAGQARIVGADGHFDVVQETLGDFRFSRKMVHGDFLDGRFIGVLLFVVETMRFAMVTWSFSFTL
jgi:hypothetical protein